MEGISKAAFVINDQAARRASFFVGVSVVAVFLVNIRKESLYCRLHVIGAAKTAHPSLFLQRVALALRFSGPGLGFPAAGRPLQRVPPVLIFGQDLVRVYPG